MPECDELAQSRLWPLHPQPRPFEPLSFWLERVAREYGTRFRPYCRHGLGLDDMTITSLSEHPSEDILPQISCRTGVPVDRLRQMTVTPMVVQFQTELGIGCGEYERDMVEWLTEQCRSYYWKDRAYWAMIEMWKNENRLEASAVSSTDDDISRV